MTGSDEISEWLDAISKVLLRCTILGFVLILLWFGVYYFAPGMLRGDFFGLTTHEVNLIQYCGIGLLKVLVLLFFFFPWVSIRLVLRRRR
jgi:hypothetical protein